MQALLQRRAFAASGARAAACRSGGARLHRVASRTNARVQRRSAVECQAFFNFFTPKPAASTKPLIDPRAEPLVDQLIAVTSRTDAGLKVTPQQTEEIASLVTELSRYCIKNPLKSDLLFGEWKVLFASKPSAAGGPLRSGAGPAVFPGQKPKQILEAPNKLINSVEYKTLGFLPGSSRQFGEFTPISPDTFILNITSGEIAAGFGAPVKKEFNIQRKIKILYLDERIRVALFLPSDDLADSEADRTGKQQSDEIVFVFERITDEAESEQEAPAADDGDAEDEEKRPAFPFAGRKLESAATVAERQVRQQLQRGGSSKVTPAAGRSPAGTAKVAAAPARAPPQRVGSTSKVSATTRGRKQAVEEEVEDPREARRRQQEEERARKAAEAKAKADADARAKEAERKAAEVKAARERAEAERQAEREKQAAIKKLLAELADEIKARQAEAREAVKELRDVEKSTGSGLKDINAARSKQEEAEKDVATLLDQLAAATNARREAESAAKSARDVVVAAERSLRAKVAAAAPRK